MTKRSKPVFEYELVPPALGTSFVIREFDLTRFTSPLHVHPEYELTVILEGMGTRFVGDNLARYGPGDLILVGPNLPHYWRSDAGRGSTRAHSVVVQFGERYLGDGFLAMPEMLSVKRLFERARRGIQFQGRRAREVAERLVLLPRTTGAVRMAEFIGILATLATVRQSRLLSGDGFLDLPDSVGTDRIRRSCRYVFEHLDGDVRLADVAREAAMSPEAFCRLFRRITGRRFFDFVNELRVTHACALLKDTERAIGDIAEASGYKTLANFNRRFKERKGCAPRDFRRKFQMG